MFTVVAALFLVPAAAQIMAQPCFPSSATMAKCFEGMTPLPLPLTDNITVAGVMSFDAIRYVTSSLMSNPAPFCEHKEHWVMIFGCVDKEMAAQCPSMPQEMRLSADKTRSALNNLCSATNSLDMGCMQNHSRLAMECHHNVTRSLMTGKGMDMNMGPPPPPPDAMNSSDPHMREERVCFFKFLMMTCVRRNMTACHQATADAMANVMRGMTSSTACESNMNTWQSAAQQGGCVGPDCEASRGVGPSAGAALVVTTATVAVLWAWCASVMG